MEEVQRQGYLFKKGGGFTLFGRQTWKRRYFVLKGLNLFYYQNQEAYNNGKPSLKQPIPLEKSKIERGDESNFSIIPRQRTSRTYVLKADNVAEREIWIKSLNSVIQPNKLHRNSSRSTLDTLEAIPERMSFSKSNYANRGSEHGTGSNLALGSPGESPSSEPKNPEDDADVVSINNQQESRELNSDIPLTVKCSAYRKSAIQSLEKGKLNDSLFLTLVSIQKEAIEANISDGVEALLFLLSNERYLEFVQRRSLSDAILRSFEIGKSISTSIGELIMDCFLCLSRYRSLLITLHKQGILVVIAYHFRTNVFSIQLKCLEFYSNYFLYSIDYIEFRKSDFHCLLEVFGASNLLLNVKVLGIISQLTYYEFSSCQLCKIGLLQCIVALPHYSEYAPFIVQIVTNLCNFNSDPINSSLSYNKDTLVAILEEMRDLRTIPDHCFNSSLISLSKIEMKRERFYSVRSIEQFDCIRIFNEPEL